MKTQISRLDSRVTTHKSRRFNPIVFLVLFLVLIPAAATSAKPLAKISVQAGSHTRIDTPVSVPLTGISDVELHLEEISHDSPARRLPVATQIEPGNPPRLWWLLSGTTPAGSKRTYKLTQAPSVKAPAVEITKNDSFLQINIGDNNVLRYNHALVPPPQGADPLYIRSGFIHPLWSPTGTILTNIHPPDHIHHLGIWMPWTNTEFQGHHVDFWNLGEGEGTVRFVKFISSAGGPVFGGFRTQHEHIDLTAAQGEKVALNETWDVRIYNLGGPENGYWLFDFTSNQRCASSSPLHLPEYRYGGLGFRGREEWSGENITFLTSEGKTREDGHATRARWCDIAGLTGKDWAGVSIMSHPKNFRHPETMRIHPKMPFFNFAPSQLGDWTIEPGKDYIFRYRFYVHEGKVNITNTERIWNDYAEPPEVKLEKIEKDTEK